MDSVIIRRESPTDGAGIRRVNHEAFGQSNEADPVDALRARGAVTLSLVAEWHDEIVGHILFTPVMITFDTEVAEAITLAPMAVLPEYQNRGSGSLLVRTAPDQCRDMGHRAVFVLGHPDYYPRFGFVPSQSRHGIDSKFEVPDEIFMALELVPGALNGIRGTVKYHPLLRECV